MPGIQRARFRGNVRHIARRLFVAETRASDRCTHLPPARTTRVSLNVSRHIALTLIKALHCAPGTTGITLSVMLIAARGRSTVVVAFRLGGGASHESRIPLYFFVAISLAGLRACLV